jgi:hypothetical protein
MGAVLVASGEKVGGWLIIASSVVGPPGALLYLLSALSRREGRSDL